MVNPGRKSRFLSDCSIVGNVAEIKVMRGSSLYSNTSLCPLAHCYSLQEEGSMDSGSSATPKGSNPLPRFSKIHAAKVFQKEKSSILAPG